MQLIICYSLAAVIYALYAYLNYSPVKDEWWYFPVGMLLSMVGNLVWMIITKIPSTNTVLFFRGVVWDAILTVVFIVIPFCFFEIRLSMLGVIGLVISLIGIFILKISLL